MLRLLLALMFVSSAVADSSTTRPWVLKFGMSSRDIEKVFGSSMDNRRIETPDFSEWVKYRASAGTSAHVFIVVYMSRDYKAERFDFRYYNGENGGRNPRDGKEWPMPASIHRKILSSFGNAKVVWRWQDGSLVAVRG